MLIVPPPRIKVERVIITRMRVLKNAESLIITKTAPRREKLPRSFTRGP